MLSASTNALENRKKNLKKKQSYSASTNTLKNKTMICISTHDHYLLEVVNVYDVLKLLPQFVLSER